MAACEPQPHLCRLFPPLQLSVELRGRLPSAGDHVLLVEYSSEEELPQTLSVTANVGGARLQRHHVTLLQCKYRLAAANASAIFVCVTGSQTCDIMGWM